MKISALMASAVLAAFLVPAVCMSQDAPPPGGPGGFGGGPGGFGGGRAFDPLAMGLQRQAAMAAKDLIAEYKNAPSDKLKEQIKAKISETFDAYVKKQKENLASFETEKAKHVDELTQSAVDGKLEPRAPRGGQGGQRRQKPE